MNLSTFTFCYCLLFEYYFACKLGASYFLVCCMIGACMKRVFETIVGSGAFEGNFSN